ncbi:rhomboid family intramembrane serine protease [Actibacterium sp. XHP0104]|uniref:rhomboid family intramembrane serine protease n=1 Tax=Actibacterium sp. XHP0104 TaxID=2984335 RepID=UPI0021E95822|nr:rhomboid family intramembrane serine protease [Actibacterium sp. XHP0104]MCV2881850.1 rhomboid family intramembrane serine protease [Actibacterium sp. XHP0104]
MPPAILLVIAALCILIELALVGADLNLWGARWWRPWLYQHAAFWRGLLVEGWRPNYPAQPFAMFVTYAFLHAGWAHLTVNMLTLLSLGKEIITRGGGRRFGAIYVASMLTGGVGFALFSDAIQPMVGASGALFGLAGAWIIWDFRNALDQRLDRRQVITGLLMPVGLLVVLNVVMYFATGGMLAWETHLGGFVGGALVALPLWARPQA